MTGSRLSGLGGIALADILANGVAVLVIAVVVSIAARVEQEQDYAQRAEDLSVVMTREFSTRLVLNRLAASPPAVLHDYEASELDQILDPDLLPILELHGEYVREFYTGTVWTRAALLQRPSRIDGWLAGFGEEKRRRLRVDVYDVGQFYLTMSILREHGIRVTHWHFLPGHLGLAEARACPPGVPASACAELEVAEGSGPPRLPDREAAPGRELDGGPGWPPAGVAAAAGEGEGAGGAGLLPGGAVPGGGGTGAPGARAGARDASGLGSFPRARSGEGAGRGLGAGRGQGQGRGEGEGEGRVRLRVALPESLLEEEGPSAPMETEADIEAYLGALMRHLSDMQRAYDAGASPSALVLGFGERIRGLLLSPPELAPDEREAVERLAGRLALARALAAGAGRGAPVAVRPLAAGAAPGAELAVPSNAPVAEVGAAPPPEGGPGLPEEARASLSLNAFPGIWRGLQVRVEQGAAFLVPPGQAAPGELRWRAVAYVSPRLDDFIVGFVHARVGPGGGLLVEPEGNRVRLGGRSLAPERGAAAFGSRGWLAALSALLALGVAALLLLWRPGRRAAA